MTIQAVRKNYHLGGQLVATRRGDEVYYTPPDPTGTSLLLVDTDGITVGHVLYDALRQAQDRPTAKP